MKIIWQTKPGEGTAFERQFLQEVVFSRTPHEAVFDGEFKIAAADAVIIFNGFGPKPPDGLLEYLKRCPNHVLVHLSEERLDHDTSYYAGARTVFRSYYDPRIKDRHVFALPLGFQSGFLSDASDRRFDDRDLVWSFAGQIKSNRKSMVAALSALRPHLLHMTRQWSDPAALGAEDLAAVYRRSLFSPCPFGNRNPDSFRLMETLEHGCIPVVLRFLDHDYFRYVMGDHPFIVERTWSAAAERMHALLRDPPLLRDKQEQVAAWYHSFKNDLAADVRDILSGMPREKLRSAQFHLQQAGVSPRTRWLYNRYYGRGLLRRAFRALVHASG